MGNNKSADKRPARKKYQTEQPWRARKIHHIIKHCRIWPRDCDESRERTMAEATALWMTQRKRFVR